MGPRSSCNSSPQTPFHLLLTVTVLAILWKAVDGSFGRSSSCKVDSCWALYDTARNAMAISSPESTKLGHSQVQCITLRTYLNCIRNVSQGCRGNLQYHTVKKTVQHKMRRFNCTVTGVVYDARIHGSVSPPSNKGSVCSYDGPPVYRHCGLFGDPHLKTFNNEFQTCKVRGAWPLINNEHLTVQVTNDPVGIDGTATATSKLTVVIKRNDECAANRFLMYQAQTDNLPGAFYDGKTHYGPEKNVQLMEKEAGKHVEIYIRYIDTTVIVRQIGRYFTFSINMPEQVLNKSNANDPSKLQLCVNGCPAQEQFDYQAFLSQKYIKLKSDKSGPGEYVGVLAMTKNVATELCRGAGVVDFYFDSCVFDLMTTGDTNFTIAANTAYKDVLRLDPDVEKTLERRQNLSHLLASSIPSCSRRTRPSLLMLNLVTTTTATTTAVLTTFWCILYFGFTRRLL